MVHEITGNGEEAEYLLSDKAYRLIKHKIATLELPPASLIDERELIEELGIGRTPIREALHRLEMEKLVTIVPRRGTFVSDVSITDLHALAEARKELEGLAARLAAERVSDEGLQQMEALLRGTNELMARDGNEELMELDQRFHHLLYQAANNRFLQDILGQLYTLSLRLWYLALDKLSPDQMRAVMEEHWDITEALGEGDPAKAEKVMQAHVMSFQRQIKEVL